MDNKRTVWAIALMMLIALVPSFFLRKPAARPGVADTAAAPAPADRAAPSAPVAVAAPAPPADSAAPAVPEDTVLASTPLAHYHVSTRGARLVALELERYRVVEKSGTTERPVNLVAAEAPVLGLALVRGRDTTRLDTWDFTPSAAQVLTTTAPENLTLRAERNGTTVELTYTFSPDDYQVGVRGRIGGIDATGATLIADLGRGLPNTEADSVENRRLGAVVTKQNETERHDFAGMTPGVTDTLNGPFEWVAIKSKYFVSALLAFDSTGGRLSGVHATPPAAGPEKPIGAHVRALMPLPATGAFAFTLYAGPMEYQRLTRIGHDFDDVNPYGWPGFRTLIRFFAVPVRWLLVWMHEQLHLGYGLVLIAFGVLVRLVLWPLNQKAMRSATAMQAIQPELQAIQTRYKSDPQRLQQEMFKLYREHNVNPFGGCWPMLLPMPVLFALFFVLGNTIELRGVPFLWFPDLARADPLYIIPVLSGISMFGLSKIGQMGIQHTPQTEMQAKMMLYMMPIMITVFGFQFASGLNLYWTVSNLASIPQQYLIGKERMKKRGAKPAVEVKTRKP